jgi:hypothetical protein
MNKTAAVVIANAIIWGVVILSCSTTLKGTGAFAEIQNYLGGGMAVTTIIILVGMLPWNKMVNKL